jgi:alginate O-acetyltransferase complex protein AlgI
VAAGRYLPSLSDVLKMLVTFTLTVFAWIFFRSATISQAIEYIAKIFSDSLFSRPQFLPGATFFFIAVLFLVEWIQREKKHGLEIDTIRLVSVRWGIYALVLIAIVSCGLFKESQFIYFQF